MGGLHGRIFQSAWPHIRTAWPHENPHMCFFIPHDRIFGPHMRPHGQNRMGILSTAAYRIRICGRIFICGRILKHWSTEKQNVHLQNKQKQPRNIQHSTDKQQNTWLVILLCYKTCEWSPFVLDSGPPPDPLWVSTLGYGIYLGLRKPQ